MRTYNTVTKLPKSVLCGVNGHIRAELDAYMKDNYEDQLDERLLGMKPIEYFKILINGMQMNRRLPEYSKRVLKDVKGEAKFYRYVKRLRKNNTPDNIYTLEILAKAFTEENIANLRTVIKETKAELFRSLIKYRDFYYNYPESSMFSYVASINDIPEEYLIGMADDRIKGLASYIEKQTTVLFEGESFKIPTINIDSINAMMPIREFVSELTSELKCN